jgi:hypothetical protein
MTAQRYRLHFNLRGAAVERELMLDSQTPVVDLLNWLGDEYEERAKMKKIFVLHLDGSEEQIYK